MLLRIASILEISFFETRSSQTNNDSVDSSNFKILLANCRSAVPKLDDIRASCSSLALDIFACTESWLNINKHSDNDIHVPNYHTFRHDRENRSGGGVLIYVKDCFRVSRIVPTKAPPNCMECVCLSITSVKTFFICAYIPVFNSNTDILQLVNEFLINTVDDLLKDCPDFTIIL